MQDPAGWERSSNLFLLPLQIQVDCLLLLQLIFSHQLESLASHFKSVCLHVWQTTQECHLEVWLHNNHRLTNTLLNWQCDIAAILFGILCVRQQIYFFSRIVLFTEDILMDAYSQSRPKQYTDALCCDSPSPTLKLAKSRPGAQIAHVHNTPPKCQAVSTRSFCEDASIITTY